MLTLFKRAAQRCRNPETELSATNPNPPAFSGPTDLVTAIAQDRRHGPGADGRAHESRGLGGNASDGPGRLLQPRRGRLWRKGEESGNIQNVREVFVDCDGDAVLLKVEQVGGAACHEGYRPASSAR